MQIDASIPAAALQTGARSRELMFWQDGYASRLAVGCSSWPESPAGRTRSRRTRQLCSQADSSGRGVLELPPSAYLSLVRAFPPRDEQQRRSNGNQSSLHDNKVLSHPAATALALCYDELIRSE
jgi:hypothetical protein